MIKWLMENSPSARPTARYWSEGYNVTEFAVYLDDGEYTVQRLGRVLNPAIAGPFDTFEAACAAYEMIKNG